MTTKYTTVKLSKDLSSSIDHAIALSPMSFGSRTDFVKYAVRRFLENDGMEVFKK